MDTGSREPSTHKRYRSRSEFAQGPRSTESRIVAYCEPRYGDLEGRGRGLRFRSLLELGPFLTSSPRKPRAAAGLRQLISRIQAFCPRVSALGTQLSTLFECDAGHLTDGRSAASAGRSGVKSIRPLSRPKTLLCHFVASEKKKRNAPKYHGRYFSAWLFQLQGNPGFWEEIMGANARTARYPLSSLHLVDYPRFIRGFLCESPRSG